MAGIDQEFRVGEIPGIQNAHVQPPDAVLRRERRKPRARVIVRVHFEDHPDLFQGVGRRRAPGGLPAAGKRGKQRQHEHQPRRDGHAITQHAAAWRGTVALCLRFAGTQFAHHLCGKAGPGLHSGQRVQPGEGSPFGLQLRAEVFGIGKTRFDPRPLRFREGAEQIGAKLFAHGLHLATEFAHAGSSSASIKAFTAVFMRDFTVPTGMANRSAISWYL